MGSPHLKAILGTSDTITLAALATGVGVELLLTFIITIAAFVTLFDRRAPKVGGFGLGLTQVAVVLFGFHLTGGSANPATWFGPAVWQLSLSSSQMTRAYLSVGGLYSSARIVLRSPQSRGVGSGSPGRRPGLMNTPSITGISLR